MMDEVIQGGQSICMALLKPGWQADYYGSPEVHSIGFADGRYNLTLLGEYKVAIQGFERDQPFRVARLNRLAEDEGWCGREATPKESQELLAMFRRFNEGTGAALDLAATFGAQMEADAVLNTIAMNLNVEPAVKQQLLEMESTELRYRAVRRALADASETQDVLDRARHRYPTDRREN